MYHRTQWPIQTARLLEEEEKEEVPDMSADYQARFGNNKHGQAIASKVQAS